MPIKMPAYKLINLLLRARMQILELMHRLKLDHIQPIRHNAVGLPLQQVLGLIRGNMADSRKHVGAVRRRALDAVAVVDPTLAGLVVHVEVLQVVVEVDAACAEVAS